MANTPQERPVIDIYARLSSAVNGQEVTVNDQIRMGAESITARGARVGEKFKDNSKSAWNPKVVRKDWETLMQRLEEGKSDGVWVYDMTRFSRKIREGERLVEMAARGILVWSRSAEYDLMTADGRAHFRDDMVAAARESDKISERTRDGKERRARRGRSVGGRRGYGSPGWLPVGPDWEKGDPREPIPPEQIEFERAIIRECYERILSGDATLTTMVSELDERGVRSVEGNRFSTTTLGDMLRRPGLAGFLVFRGEVVGTLAHGEEIVSPEDWRRMCGIFDARRRGRPIANAHILAGLMRCTRCGQKIYGITRRERPADETGMPPRKYRCQKTVNRPKACGRNSFDARTAEAMVGEAVKKRLGDPRRAERIAGHLARVRDERGRLEAERAVLQESADGLAEKTAEWGLDRVNKAMVPVLEAIKKIDRQLAQITDEEDPGEAAQDAARAWDDAYEHGDVETLRAMVKRAFPRLAVRPPTKKMDHSPERFDWDGASLPE